TCEQRGESCAFSPLESSIVLFPPQAAGYFNNKDQVLYRMFLIVIGECGVPISADAVVQEWRIEIRPESMDQFAALELP
ncbi:MAG: hypothetical protein AAFO08_07635, partial [Pseudomonadota bacterium]